jgi:glycosyltransferase involved in cell wall biosynthesis
MNPLLPSSRPTAVDVVVPVYKDVAVTVACLKSVLAHSGSALDRLTVIDDLSPDRDMSAALLALAKQDPRVELVTNERNLGFVRTCNEALARRRGDLVLLNSDTVVTDGWLSELMAVAYTDERTACVSPLSNNATLCSVPEFPKGTRASEVSEPVVRRAVAGLPRSTIVPTAVGFCLYLRGAVLDVVGGFDPIYSPGYNEENDWIMRAQGMGFVARRANHAFVYHLGSVSFDDKKTLLEEEHARILNRRYPHYLPQVHQFGASLDGHLAAHAVRIESTGRMRVALDLRSLGPNKVGSNVYAHRLAELLARSPEIALTVVEYLPQGLEHLGARVLRTDEPITDVDIIHKPSQVFQAYHMPLLYNSPAHVVLTYQDLIAHHAQVVWNSTEVAEVYRALGYCTLQAAQGVIAYSHNTQREIAAEFQIPEEEISVVPIGMDVGQFDSRRAQRAALREEKGVPARYILSVATDFPHKNLAGVVAAHRQLCREWNGALGPPPSLVMVGSACSVPNGFYRQLAAAPMQGVSHYQEIDDEFLYALYQGALAMVFGSVYEGYGMPPLEAMAAGTPVVAMRVSAVEEVCGEAAIYPKRLDPQGIAEALSTLLGSPALRAEHIAAGRARVQSYTLQRTLELTLGAYKKAWRTPPERSLRARRFNTQQFLALQPRPVPAPPPEPAPPPARGLRSSVLSLLGRVSSSPRR